MFASHRIVVARARLAPSAPRPAGRRGVAAFTLVELLVVIGVITLLVGVLLPVLGRAREAAKRTFCLNNLRNMEAAEWNYTTDNRGYLIQAGLGHDSEADDLEVAWFTTLNRYYQNKLAIRCPSDDSPYWPDGRLFVPGSSPPKHRLTSYCINDFVAGELYCPWGPGFVVPCPRNQLYVKMSRIRRTSATIQFAELVYTGSFAGADHCHVENWVSNVANSASKNLETDAHGGRAHRTDALANYGFLDGHAETLRFGQVFTDFNVNQFDPAVAQ